MVGGNIYNGSKVMLEETFLGYRYIVPQVRINKWALSLFKGIEKRFIQRCGEMDVMIREIAGSDAQKFLYLNKKLNRETSSHGYL